MTQLRVLVVGNDSGVQKLFHQRGFKVEFDTAEHQKFPSSIKADLICFCGGEDVNPSLYNEKQMFRTRTNPRRDAIETRLYEHFRNYPKVGVCRGGQLLNVLNNGAMWQHVTNHANGPHDMIDLFSKKKIRVTSCHHQMMIPAKEGYLLGVSEHVADEYHSIVEREVPEFEPEVIWYPKTKSLCYQPHPEYYLPVKEQEEHQDYFFKLIDWAFL